MANIFPAGSQNRQKELDLIPFFMSPDKNVYSVYTSQQKL